MRYRDILLGCLVIVSLAQSYIISSIQDDIDVNENQLICAAQRAKGYTGMFHFICKVINPDE